MHAGSSAAAVGGMEGYSSVTKKTLILDLLRILVHMAILPPLYISTYIMQFNCYIAIIY